MNGKDQGMDAETTTQDALDLMLGEARGRFFATHWEREAFHAKGAPGRFAHLLNFQGFLAALGEAALVKAGFRDAKGWYADLKIEPGQAPRMIEAGMGLCATQLQPSGAIGVFLASYKAGLRLAGVAQFNAYYSPDGLGFRLHLDDHPVFILQLEGSKRWWYSVRPGAVRPGGSFQMPPDRRTAALAWGEVTAPTDDELENVLLEPGDLLYLPAGCWHRTEAKGGSLALTLATFGMTTAELLQNLLMRDPLTHRALMSRLPGTDRQGQDPEGAARLIAHLTESLDRVRAHLAALPPEAAHAMWEALAARDLHGSVRKLG